jgi:hypothetical protein
MAEFDFLGSWDDSWRIMASILQIDHIQVIPDLKFERPEPIFITALDDKAKELLLDRRNVFLWSRKFSRFPPAMVRIEGGVNAGKHFLDLSGAGPGLRLVLPACYEKDGLWKLAVGSLYYQKETFNPEAHLWEKPTPELIAGYKEVKGVLRPHLAARHEFALHVPIGHDALRLLRERKAVIAGLEQ